VIKLMVQFDNPFEKRQQSSENGPIDHRLRDVYAYTSTPVVLLPVDHSI
jgi:hypothetical protein